MEEYLIHYGVLGMKWGVRRYQNPDGTLTEAGKKKYTKQVQKSIKKYGTFTSDPRTSLKPKISKEDRNKLRKYHKEIGEKQHEQIESLVNIPEMKDRGSLYNFCDKHNLNWILDMESPEATSFEVLRHNVGYWLQDMYEEGYFDDNDPLVTNYITGNKTYMQKRNESDRLYEQYQNETRRIAYTLLDDTADVPISSVQGSFQSGSAADFVRYQLDYSDRYN